MPNGTDTDDQTRQIIAPQPASIAPSAAPLMVAPGRTPIASPSGITLPSPAQAQAGEAMRRTQFAVADMPLAQATAAVESAIRFQAQRGYQNDIQGGMAPAEAMAKWGPSLFGSTAGSAAAVSRAAIAARPQSRVLRGPGGQLFRVGQTGQGEAITPPAGTKPVAPASAVKQILSNQAAIRRLEGVTPENVADVPFTPEGDVLRSRNAELHRQIAPPPPAAAPASPATTSGRTVTRKTKDGRRAVFDAATRQFLRYAD